MPGHVAWAAKARAPGIVHHLYAGLQQGLPAGSGQATADVGIFQVHEIALVKTAHLRKGLGIKSNEHTGRPVYGDGLIAPGIVGHARSRQESIGQPPRKAAKRGPLADAVLYPAIGAYHHGGDRTHARAGRPPQRREQIGQIQGAAANVGINHHKDIALALSEGLVVVGTKPQGRRVAQDTHQREGHTRSGIRPQTGQSGLIFGQVERQNDLIVRLRDANEVLQQGPCKGELLMTDDGKGGLQKG